MPVSSLPMIDAGVNLADKGWVTKEYIMEVYPELLADYINSELWVWGNNASGQLGDNTTVNKSSPVQILGSNWRKVSSGDSCSAGLKTDGSLWVWGSNSNGRLGTNNTTNYSSPVQTIIADNNWVDAQISTFLIGSRTDNYLWGCGLNTYGQLGINNTTTYSSPVQLYANDFKQIELGGNKTALISNDGKLYTMGRNLYGSLGDGTAVNRSSPVQILTAYSDWVQVNVGYEHGGAIRSDGSLWTWGRNNYGQLGDGTRTTRSSPVQISGTWRRFSCNNYFSLGVRQDGTLWAWGYNSDLNVTASGGNRSSPTQADSSTAWTTCQNSYGTGFALKVDGLLYSWGGNIAGQLGQNAGEFDFVAIPGSQTLVAINRWKQISTTYGYYPHALAIADQNY